MFNKRVLILVILGVSAIFASCVTSTNDDDESEIIAFENENTAFPVLTSAKFQINEFVRDTHVDMSLLTAETIVYDLPMYAGDAGSLYDEYTVPTIEQLYMNGVVGKDLKVNEQGVAIVKVFAYYPQNIQDLERGALFDCFVISTGNASNIVPGKIIRSGLKDSRFSSEDYYAIVDGSLENLKNIEEHEELNDIVPSDLIDRFKAANRAYIDGTVHMPRVYFWKKGVKLVKKPPRNRSAEPVIRLRLNTDKKEILSGIKESICEVLPYLPDEIKTNVKENWTDILIDLPIGYQIEPYSFSEQLKQRVFTVRNVRQSFVIYNKPAGEIAFLGRVPKITKGFKSMMIIQDGAESKPYAVIPKFTSSTLTVDESTMTEIQEPETEITVWDEDKVTKTNTFIVKSHDSDQVIRVLNEKLGYGVLEILNFFKQAITQDAIDTEILERSMYFVFNQDKTAKFYPLNKLIAFGSEILDVELTYKNVEDDEKTEKNEAETLIDLKIPTKNANDIMELAVSLPSIDNSVFYVVDSKGKRSKYRILISDSEYNKISDAKIEGILNSEDSAADRYYRLFSEITKLARLTSRIEMNVGKLDDKKLQTTPSSPNDNNARTIRITRYFIEAAIKKLEQAELSDLDKDMLYENQRRNILDKTNIIPQVPMRIFAMIKEEKYGLKDYPFFNDYLRTIDLDNAEWAEVFENRLKYIELSVESDEMSETDKKKAVIREIEAHRKIPFFNDYVLKLRITFAKTLE